MLGFTKNCFRGFIEVSLWINLILSAIIGGNIIGKMVDNTFLGVVIGLIIGIYTNMFYGGLIATFLNIDEKTENTDRNVYDMKCILEQQERYRKTQNSSKQECSNKQSSNEQPYLGACLN